MKPFAIALLALVAAACGGPKITATTLHGRWKGDFEASWPLSKDAFLKDTMRGAAAYPKDPAEKERIVRGEMKPVVDEMVHDYKADGSLDKTAMKKTTSGRFKVTNDTAPVFEVEETAGRTMAVRIEFRDANSFLWQPKKGGPTLVFRRL